MTAATATTWTVTLDDEDMAVFVACAATPGIVEAMGGATLVLTATEVDRLKALPSDCDGSVTDDENGLQVWVGGIGYPLRPV